MTRNALLVALSFAPFVAVVACSSDEATDKYPSADSFCSAKADTECQAAAPVCAANIDTCKTTRTQSCNSAAGQATGGGRTYRPAQADKCINDTKTLYATKVVDLDKEKTVEDECQRVFTGSKNKGDACTQPYDCSGELVCDRGHCAEKKPVGLNDGCANPGETCATGTYCQAQGGVSTCVARNAAGEICKDTAPCLETLRCVNTCVDKVDSGGACDKNDDCKTGFCGKDKKCAAKLVPGAGGCSDFGGS